MQSPDASIISPHICPDNDINSMAMNTQTTAEVTAGCHTIHQITSYMKQKKNQTQSESLHEQITRHLMRIWRRRQKMKLNERVQRIGNEPLMNWEGRNEKGKYFWQWTITDNQPDLTLTITQTCMVFHAGL